MWECRLWSDYVSAVNLKMIILKGEHASNFEVF